MARKRYKPEEIVAKLRLLAYWRYRFHFRPVMLSHRIIFRKM